MVKNNEHRSFLRLSAYNCNKSTFLSISRCLLFVSASIDFDKILSMCISDITLQILLFRFSVQAEMKKVVGSDLYQYFLRDPDELNLFKILLHVI